MKLNEIKDPKKEVEVEPEAPSMFLRPQAGPKLTAKDRVVIARNVRLGRLPVLLRKQAESVEL